VAGYRGVPVRSLAYAAEQVVQQAAGIEAASRERERIARGIHDPVLQVLALVHRRGMEACAAGRYGLSGLGAPYPIRSTAWPPGSVIGVLHAGRYSARCALISAWIQPG
jgi:hypothetical protein